MKRSIEEYFPIVDINRLAVPERNAFKPIYQMHKWFARRASCIFRAVILGCLKPAGTDIMAEFYRDHTDDPDTNGKVILDPFMGGGTTVVEALRLGSKVVGIDLNPVAWFIVKTEVETVNIEELKVGFDQLANRAVSWSGKSVRETLLNQYKTECPCCSGGDEDADIIYTFWVKSAICHSGTCQARSGEKGAQVPLFSDYIVAQKKPSIRFHRDMRCPQCRKTFDWEIEPASLIADPKLMMADPRTSAGELRGNVRWGYSAEKSVVCPWCDQEVSPIAPSAEAANKKRARPERKKVPLSVLLCPHCQSVWQWRGELPAEVGCPACQTIYDPHRGNVAEKGKFVCEACGTKDAIITSIRKLHEDELLPVKPYGIEGYCARCAGDDRREPDSNGNLFAEEVGAKAKKRAPDHSCLLSKNNGKFFKRINARDLARYQRACQLWEAEKERLPYPKQKIPVGEKTKSGLLAHHFRYWHQLFNPRQLLCLATLLRAIDEEEDQVLKELLLLAFSNTLEANNLFTRYIAKRTTPGGTPPAGIFARHDFQPKATLCEQNVWGVQSGNNTFRNRKQAVLEAVEYARAPWDSEWDVETNWVRRVPTAERFSKRENAELKSQDSRGIRDVCVDLVITDPPYAGNVNYSELSDFFYVWLRLVLAKDYPAFAPEITAKADEIIENPTRGKSAADFERGLTEVFQRCFDVLKVDGILAFTFHHSEGTAWESLLRSICNAGFEIDSVYPVHSEREASLHLLDKESAISYDLIHVCKKRTPNATVERRSWAGVRQEIRARARRG
jgi:putative DNA methylase